MQGSKACVPFLKLLWSSFGFGGEGMSIQEQIKHDEGFQGSASFNIPRKLAKLIDEYTALLYNQLTSSVSQVEIVEIVEIRPKVIWAAIADLWIHATVQFHPLEKSPRDQQQFKELQTGGRGKTT
ncbi:hypothetical protein BS47DRAFT_1361854 [Hydnum rufescens UP504]|uniref:Uncharacterized protein n=1 Tax=Hydnum rufescens UP504 TaxID=1448309 RepID=A0A9P6AYG5_9AGAM|nr:hypothetical protein BS47DRAFT_1361854 [Hydnum rufescens UP504]